MTNEEMTNDKMRTEFSLLDDGTVECDARDRLERDVSLAGRRTRAGIGPPRVERRARVRRSRVARRAGVGRPRLDRHTRVRGSRVDERPRVGRGEQRTSLALLRKQT